MSNSDNLAGFELCPPNTASVEAVFTPGQAEYWKKLPSCFRFDDVADKLVPRATLGRLLKRAKSVGWIEQEGDGTWQKLGDL